MNKSPHKRELSILHSFELLSLLWLPGKSLPGDSCYRNFATETPFCPTLYNQKDLQLLSILCSLPLSKELDNLIIFPDKIRAALSLRDETGSHVGKAIGSVWVSS